MCSQFSVLVLIVDFRVKIAEFAICLIIPWSFQLPAEVSCISASLSAGPPDGADSCVPNSVAAESADECSPGRFTAVSAPGLGTRERLSPIGAISDTLSDAVIHNDRNEMGNSWRCCRNTKSNLS
jgi:hypothetical protein